MPEARHKLSGLPLYPSTDIGTDELLRSLSALQARKEEKERLRRAEERQAELDRMAAEDRLRKQQIEDENRQLEATLLQEKLAAQTEPIPGGEVKISPTSVTLKEPPIPPELEPSRGQPERVFRGEDVPIGEGFEGVAPPSLPFCEGRTLKIGDTDLRIPFRYAPEVREEGRRKLAQALEFSPALQAALLREKGKETPEERLKRELAVIREQAATRPPTARFDTVDDAYGGTRVFDKVSGKFVDGQGSESPFAGQDELLENAARSAISGLPATRQKPALAEVVRRVKAGKLDDAKEFIKRAALNGVEVDARKDVRSRDETIRILNNVKGILQKLPTNIVRGTIEDTIRRLGKTTNPQYVSLANELKSALFAYRKAMTGVQFSEKESKGYERMFPNYRNDPTVNMALIEGLIDGFTARNDVFWESALSGKAEAVFVGAIGSSGTEGEEEWERDASGRLVRKN